MKLRQLLTVGIVMFSVGLGTACSKVKDAKDANNMQKEGNSLATEINAEQKALESEGIYISSPTLAKLEDWKGKSAEKKAELRTRLTNLLPKLNRYLEIAHHKNMRVEGNGAWKADLVQEGVMTYINSLDKHENKTQSYPQHKV